MDFTERKAELLEAFRGALSKFIDENISEEYYCMALTCNYEYGEILLGLNSESEFAETLACYQAGEFGHTYQSDEDILELKYNTGDWSNMALGMPREYNYVANEEQLTEVYGDDIDAQIADMKKFAQELLLMLIETDEYKRIPKTADFSPMIIDHDEEPVDALDATKAYLKRV